MVSRTRQDGGVSHHAVCVFERIVMADTMTKNLFSMIVICRHELQTNTTRLHVVRTDTAEEVSLDSSSFLVRISMDDETDVERCFIRHIASGREVYVQSGPGLRTFITSCLLADTSDSSS